MSAPESLGVVLGQLVVAVVEASARADAERQQVLAREIADLRDRVRRLSPLTTAMGDAARRRVEEIEEAERARRSEDATSRIGPERPR